MELGREFYASALLAGGKVSVVAAKPEFQLVASNDLGDRSAFNASPVDGKFCIASGSDEDVPATGCSSRPACTGYSECHITKK
jgi:hypothetical protein